MLMTEQEARDKWCPFALVGLIDNIGGTGAVAGNRLNSRPNIPQGCNCIASNCAAWRWTDTGFTIDGTDAKGIIYRSTNNQVQGRCGLAGIR